MKYILSIDQSTAGTKGTLFDKAGKLIARCDIPHRQIVNDKGWVEHDATEIIANIYKVTQKVMEKAGADSGSIAAVGISNQRETSVCWDKNSGEPLYNAIVWQCPRAEEINAEICARVGVDYIKSVTGLQASPFFSASKFAWLVRNVESVKAAQKNNTLCCGTMDSWIVYKLTGNFKTDYSNASRTQLLNLDKLKWDEGLVQAFGLNLYSLPEICMSDSLFGYTDMNGLLCKEVPIHGVLGDSHAALFGNKCILPGMAKATLGTGSSVMMNVGSSRPKDTHGAVTSLAWGMNNKVEFVLEGNINYAGAVIK
ncbi:MAG: FGGY family carbohydrate kinase, partial [Christensenella sp.]